MTMKFKVEKEQLIFCSPINEHTSKWGVYCIPRMWRRPDGSLAIYFNGSADTPDSVALKRKACPDLFFVSNDEGNTWHKADENSVDLGVLGSIDSPFLRLENGNCICIRGKDSLNPVHDCVPVKAFRPPNNGQGINHAYRLGDLPKDVFSCELLTYDKNGKLIGRDEVNIDFPEREMLTMGEIPDGNGGFVKCPEWIKAGDRSAPFISSIQILPDGTLCGTCYGQDPDVSDRYCGRTYFMVSADGGKSWNKRSCITKNSSKYTFGLAGDGYESSLSVGDDGTVYFVARTDMSINHPLYGGITDTVFCVSKDNGHTWSDERMIADSSVTPHVLAFKNGAVVVIYGRPGVHMILSEDGGERFSEPVSIIGKTLTQELNSGKEYLQAKHYDADSYCNTFVERISDNSFLILYTDLKYDPGDGLCHKAGLVKKITVCDE